MNSNKLVTQTPSLFLKVFNVLTLSSSASGMAVAQHHTLSDPLHAVICAKRSCSPKVMYLFVEDCYIPSFSVFTGRVVIQHVCSQKLLAKCILSDPISYKRKLFAKLLCSAVIKQSLTYMAFI